MIFDEMVELGNSASKKTLEEIWLEQVASPDAGASTLVVEFGMGTSNPHPHSSTKRV